MSGQTRGFLFGVAVGVVICHVYKSAQGQRNVVTP